jgi:WD40 repeat protein
VTTDGTTASWAFIPAGGISYTAVKTSNYSAAVNDGVQTDTSGGSFTVTLPATPAVGDQVIVTDSAGSWATNNLTVGRNGSTIEGTATDLICNISSVSVQLVYSGTTWDVFAQAGGAGGVIDINTQTTGTLTVPRGGTGATTLTGVVKGNGTSAMTAGTVTVAEGGTGVTTLTANAVLVGNGTSAVSSVAPGTLGNILTSNGTSWTSAAAPSSVVQYPQNIQAGNYTLVLGDAGKQIFHPASDTATSTYTIPANASVAFPIGTVVLFTAENGGILVNVSITSDTLVFGNGSTGSINVQPNNTLMCIKVTATKWMANYLYQTGSPYTQSIAVAHDTSPFVTAYPWSGSGFGTKFANPATLPTGAGYGVAFSPSGNAIAVAHNTSPFVTAYPWSGSGFGVKYANPATLPTNFSNSVAFSPSGNAIAVAHDTTPFVTAYPWSGGGFGVKYANPATLPTGNAYGVAFSPSGNAIAVAHNTSPFVTAYPWSGSGFGTKFADPATLPTGGGTVVAFSPSGDAVAVAHATSPFVTAYPWSGSGFGTKFANPATLPTGTANGLAFNPSGNAIVLATNTPTIDAYSWSVSGFGTKYSNPATVPSGVLRGAAFSPSGDAVAVAGGVAPSIAAYSWSGSGFGAKFADPATSPVGVGYAVAFTVNP